MADEKSDRSEVENLLKLHSSLKLKTNEGINRVVCELSSHEMPCTVNAIQAYVNGRKYKCQVKNRLTEKEQELCTQYLELKKRGQLYCKLTKKYINNLPHHIRQHLEGRKFKKALENGPCVDLHKQSPDHDIVMDDKDNEMWIPSESESESIGDEGLENELNTEKTVTQSAENDDYSFDVLDVDSEADHHIETSVETKTKKRKQTSVNGKKKDGMKYGKKRKVKHNS